MEKNNRLRILFVTTDEYPFFGTTSNLIKKLVFDGGLIKGNKIGVLSLCNNYSRKNFEIVDNVRIYRALSYSELSGEKFWEKLAEENIYDKILPFAEKSAWWLYEKTGACSRLFRPNNVLRLVQAIEHIVDKKYDFVIPISGNYDSVIAVLLAKINAKKIFWQVDPCSTNLVRLKREKRISEIIEKNIIDKFDAILTDEIYFNELVSLYGQSIINKVYIFHLPLIDISNNIKVKKLKNSNEINCVFTGLIYLGIRDPGYTIKLFNELGKDGRIKFHLYGPDRKDVPYECSDAIVFHKKVNMEEAKQIIQNADILVNIGNKMSNQIPSKIYEYISTGLPIINVYKNTNCPTLNLLNIYSNSISVYENESNFTHYICEINDFITHHLDAKISNDIILNKFEDYIPSKCTNKFLYIIYSL